MAGAIRARRQGDEYQARLFWINLLEMRTGDYIEEVCFESDDISFVDDIIVKYKIPITERSTGNTYSCDYFQCKYHVTQGGAFSKDALFDPEFINNKEKSMIKRLYEAYLKLRKEGISFRLIIFSNYNWHPDDEISKHLSEERIRDTFFENGPTSRLGKIRAEFVKHLNITHEELRDFLNTVRFRLGKNLIDLCHELEPRLKLASLSPIDPTATNVIYDDLAWKWFEQGRNVFCAETLDTVLKEDKLVIMNSPLVSEISICSFPQFARRPRDVQAFHLDLFEHFDGRFVRSVDRWNKEIPEILSSCLLGEDIKNLPQPIHLFFDCHLSIAFFAGTVYNRKYGIQIIPAHKSTSSGYELWPEPDTNITGLLIISEEGKINNEVIVAISISNPIGPHLLPYLEASELKDLPKIFIEPTNSVGQKAIQNGYYAWQLAFEIRTRLRELLPAQCNKMHLFFSCPVALAYIFGNTLSGITNCIQLYEHDFEGERIPERYYPSITILNK